MKEGRASATPRQYIDRTELNARYAPDLKIYRIAGEEVAAAS